MSEDNPLPKRIPDEELTVLSAGAAHHMLETESFGDPVAINPTIITTGLERELIKQGAESAMRETEFIKRENTDSLTGLGSRERLQRLISITSKLSMMHMVMRRAMNS
jgi:hypothetical protein